MSIGIDEIAYKRGHNYITVVVDYDSGRLVWAAAGRDNPTLNRFFDELGPVRCAQITHVSSDAAGWIADVVTARSPQAIRCADPLGVSLGVRAASPSGDHPSVRPRSRSNKRRSGPCRRNRLHAPASHSVHSDPER